VPSVQARQTGSLLLNHLSSWFEYSGPPRRAGRVSHAARLSRGACQAEPRNLNLNCALPTGPAGPGLGRPAGCGSHTIRVTRTQGGDGRDGDWHSVPRTQRHGSPPDAGRGPAVTIAGTPA
jgi:hypothetical protein